MSTESDKPLWTWAELGEYLGLKRSAVKALVRTTDIPRLYPTGLGGKGERFDPDEVRAWVHKRRTKSSPGLVHPNRRTRHVA
jgi:predicted DNA-binding transcriptional regulator AlpA